MRLFVLVVLFVGAMYPIARQPMLRVFAFAGMMMLYAGAGAVWWNEHDCRLTAAANPHWNLAVLTRAPSNNVTCSGLQPASPGGFLMTAAYVER